MVQIDVPDAEELGGNVTKPFKFVTGVSSHPASNLSEHCESVILTSGHSWYVLRASLEIYTSSTPFR